MRILALLSTLIFAGTPVGPGKTLSLPLSYVRTDVELKASIKFENSLDTIRIGFGPTAYRGGCLDITPDNLTFLETDLLGIDTLAAGKYRYNFGPKPVWGGKAHGLTVGKDLDIVIRSHHGYADLVLESGGVKVEQRLDKWWEGGIPYLVNKSSESLQAELGFTRLKSGSPVWFYGDSYFNTLDPHRWAYYMRAEGFDDWMADHIPGGSSREMLQCFKNDLESGTPKTAVWMLGMNDGRDGDALDPVWLSCVQEFISICREKGIEPVLTTVPTVPERFHDAKTEWVRASGCRYIDWYNAVGTNSRGEWADGLLSPDRVHPSEKGAKALWREVRDVLWPNRFEKRAYYLDFRTQVLTPAAMDKLADRAASNGINTIIVEWEATFPFEQNKVLCNRYKFTRAQVMHFIEHCTALGIDVIPLQNCFGHCEYILMHQAYAHLRESSQDFSQVCPSCGDEAEKAFESIFSEIAAAHPSKYIHIGADETRLLGFCQKCKGRDKSDLVVDYICRMCNIVRSLGKTPIVWSDMITTYPDAFERLPKDVILMEWNYGWEATKFGDLEPMIDAGYDVWGASAMRSHPDDMYITQWDKHFANLENFVAECRRKGYKGMVETSWSTSGQYGYNYAQNFDAVRLNPIREVYPMSAFNILLDGFAAASSGPGFKASEFVEQYASAHFGEASAEVLKDFFFTSQHQTSGWHFRSETIEEEIAKCENLRARMDDVKVRGSGEEWAQLVLMLDIRLNYLRFRRFQLRLETVPAVDVDPAALKMLIKESDALQKRFCALNKDYLKDPAASFSGPSSYVAWMREVYECISK